jgi:hypothetical protein
MSKHSSASPSGREGSDGPDTGQQVGGPVRDRTLTAGLPRVWRRSQPPREVLHPHPVGSDPRLFVGSRGLRPPSGVLPLRGCLRSTIGSSPPSLALAMALVPLDRQLATRPFALESGTAGGET